MPFQPLKPPFLRRKLSPLGHPTNIPVKKVFQLHNYRAYNDHTHVVSANDKMAMLDSFESKEKLSMCLRGRGNDLVQSQDELLDKSRND